MRATTDEGALEGARWFMYFSMVIALLKREDTTGRKLLTPPIGDAPANIWGIPIQLVRILWIVFRPDNTSVNWMKLAPMLRVLRHNEHFSRKHNRYSSVAIYIDEEYFLLWFCVEVSSIVGCNDDIRNSLRFEISLRDLVRFLGNPVRVPGELPPQCSPQQGQ